MYYKYRSSKKRGKKLKLFTITAVIFLIAYLLYNNFSSFKFWEYSFSKVERNYNEIIEEKNLSDRRDKLESLSKEIEESIKEDVYDEKSLTILAKINFNLGEIYFGNNFTSLIIKDDVVDVPINTKKYFLKSIKFIKKIEAANENGVLSDELLIILSKEYYYLDYYGRMKIYEIMNEISDPENIKLKDDKRFYGYFHYVLTEEEQYLDYLTKINSDDIQGKMFMAGVYLTAKKYTNSIMIYKNLLNESISQEKRLIVLKNLGKIYFYQSLFEESLNSLLKVYESKPHDSEVRELIYKIYIEQDNKEKALLYKN